MAKADLLKSIALLSVNEKKACGMGLSSRDPKLWYSYECTYLDALFSTQTDVQLKCSK